MKYKTRVWDWAMKKKGRAESFRERGRERENRKLKLWGREDLGGVGGGET